MLDRRRPFVYPIAMQESVLVAPSILSADFGHLADEIASVERAGADWIHVDIMDGRFVPNITMGPGILQAVRRATSLPLDVHLMIVEPERYLEAFADAGADRLTVQAEASTHLQRILSEIRRLGKRAGVALNPHTSEEVVRYVLEDLDQVLVMTVNPGFGGQEFLPSTLPKIERLRDCVQRAGLSIQIEVDGGIAPGTARRAYSAGARVFVAGAAVFGAQDRRAVIEALRREARHDAAATG
jgi:ribulose-phosphate 3-epimerase